MHEGSRCPRSRPVNEVMTAAAGVGLDFYAYMLILRAGMEGAGSNGESWIARLVQATTNRAVGWTRHLLKGTGMERWSVAGLFALTCLVWAAIRNGEGGIGEVAYAAMCLGMINTWHLIVLGAVIDTWCTATGTDARDEGIAYEVNKIVEWARGPNRQATKRSRIGWNLGFVSVTTVAFIAAAMIGGKLSGVI